METKATQQEVLLNTDTAFAHRQWTDRGLKNEENLSALENLEKACWDGLVKELIPELDITLKPNQKLWLWQIQPDLFSRWIIMNIPDRRKKRLPLIPICLWMS